MFLIKTKNSHTLVVLDYVTKQLNSMCNLPREQKLFLNYLEGFVGFSSEICFIFYLFNFVQNNMRSRDLPLYIRQLLSV